MADDAQPVDVVDDHCRVAAGEFGRSAVDVHNLNLAAADRGAGQGGQRSVGGLRDDAHRVRMHVAQVRALEGDLDAALFGDFQRVFQLWVIGVHAQHAADQRTVGAVAPQGQMERAMQDEVHRLQLLVRNHVVHRLADALCAGGVRAGRADHDGAQNIEHADVHNIKFPL